MNESLIFMNIYTWISFLHIDRKETPPPGGLPIYYDPSSRTVSKRTPLEEFVPGAFRGVLLLTVIDEATWQIGNAPGGGFCFDQHEYHWYSWISTHEYHFEYLHTWISTREYRYSFWDIHVCDMTHFILLHAWFICVTWLIHLCDVTHSHLHVTCSWMSWTTHTESCHTCDWVMSHIWMSHVAHMSESCHTHERVTIHTREGGYVTHMNESCHTHIWADVMRDYMCDMTHSYVCHDPFICVTWLIHMCGMRLCVACRI